MNWIDTAILSVIGLSILIGIFRGFVREAMSLVNWTLAIGGGIYFHDLASGYLKNYIASDAIRSVVAFGIVFLIILISCSIITHFISLLVRKSGLGGTDRMLGLVFGFVRGILVCSILLLVVSFSPVKKQPIWHQAMFTPYFNPIMSWLNDNVPDKVNFAKDALDKSSTPKKDSNVHGALANIDILKHYQTSNRSSLAQHDIKSSTGSS